MLLPTQPYLNSSPDEAANLETDVMRFMAILGFCLMIIFALVQAIPMVPQATDAGVDTTPEPAKKVKKAGKVTESFSMPVTMTLAPTPADTEVETSATTSVQTEILTAEQDQAPDPVQPNPRQESTPSETPHWSLRFASDDAMLQLLRQDLIGVFVRTDGELRQLNAAGVATPVAGQFKLYPMQPDTVPVFFRTLMSNQYNDELAWSVSLSSKLQQQLRQSMQQDSPGTLLIQANGVVIHQTDSIEVPK